MPSTLLGLLILAYILIPGYFYQLIRRSLVPTPRITTLIGAANFVCVAIVSNTITALLFAMSQRSVWIRDHSPDVVQLLRSSESYLLVSNARLAYIGGWAVAMIAVSCVVAAGLAYLLYFGSKRVGVGMSIDSTWHHVFWWEVPEHYDVAIECVLENGVSIEGILDSYNADLDDTPDRDLTIRPPGFIRLPNGHTSSLGHRRVIVSARQISRLVVHYVESEEEVNPKRIRDTLRRLRYRISSIFRSLR